MISKTKQLVKKCIKWNRKWLDEPNYLHSYRIYDLLVNAWYNKDICIAWLLHDILEDSVITENDLIDLWYNDTIIWLVKACTHDKSIKNSFEKWKHMMDKISVSWNTDALIIKIADFIDNIKQCYLLKPDRYYNFVYKKAPYIMKLMYKHLDTVDFDTSMLKDIFFDVWNEQKFTYSWKMFD